MLIAGLALLALAAVTPPGWIAGAFPGGDAVRTAKLLLGAYFFKGSLALLGLLISGCSRLPGTGFAPRQQERREAWAWPALAVLLGISLALRLYSLGTGLWLDEILTHVNYARMSFGEILSTYASENQHFLFSLLAHAAYQTLGETPFALRLPAALFGVASIGALYFLGRLVAPAREAMIAATLFALSYHHIWFSQNARGYSGLLFFAILSSYYFIRAKRERSMGVWTAFAITCALGVYTHTTMVFVVLGQFFVLAIETVWKKTWRENLNGLVLGFPLSGLLTIQLHALVIPQIFSGMKGTVSVVETWKSPLWTLLEIINGLNVGFAGVAAAVVAIGLFAWGVISYLKDDWSIVGLAVFPPVLGAAVVLGVGHHLWPRFFYFAFGFLTLIFVRGALRAGRAAGALVGGEPAGRFASVALAILMVAAAAVSAPRAYGPKQDYEGGMRFIEGQRQPGDVAVAVGLASFPLNKYYQANWPAVDTLEQLQGIRGSGKRVWVLYTLQPVLEAVAPKLFAEIQHDFKLVRKFPGTLQNGTVYVYVAEPQQAAKPAAGGMH